MFRVVSQNKRTVFQLCLLCILILASCTSTPIETEPVLAKEAVTVEERVPRDIESAMDVLDDIYSGIDDADEALAVLEQSDSQLVDPETRLIYAILLYSQNRVEESRSELESLLEHDPLLAEAWFYMSLIEDVIGNKDARDRALDTAIEIDKNMAEAWAFRGQLAITRSNWIQAETDLKQALRLKPEFVESLVGLAWVYAKNEKLNEALTILDQAVNIEPTYAYARVDRARVNVSLGNYGAAGDDLGVAIVQEPDVSWHYLDRARIRLRYFKDYEGALSDLEKVEELDPGNFFAMVYLAGLHEENRRFSLSETYYKKVVEMRPDYIWSYMPMGKFAWMRGQYNEAAEWFAKAAAEDSTEFSLQLMTAMSLLRAHREKEAQAKFQETLSRFKPGETAYDVVRFCIEQNSVAFAVRALNRETNEKLKDRLWFYIGAIYEIEGDTAGAHSVFKKMSEMRGEMEYDLAWVAVNGMGD